MMMMPEFVKSPYFYVDKDGWKLRDDAPEELKQEFKRWFEAKKARDEAGISA